MGWWCPQLNSVQLSPADGAACVPRAQWVLLWEALEVRALPAEEAALTGRQNPGETWGKPRFREAWNFYTLEVLPV